MIARLYEERVKSDFVALVQGDATIGDWVISVALLLA